MSDATLSGRGGRLSALAIAFVLAGIALRLACVGRPFDHRLRAPWRQSDYVQMARNFAREDPNILHPRIDWRGDTPGLVESEFPLVPWTAGMFYRLTGEEPRVMRALSALFSIGTLLLGAALARRLLPPAGATFAVATVALNPLLFHLATAMQPEPLMLFLSVLAVDLLERWSTSLRPATLVLAGAALGGAILAKAPAACLGILFACVILSRLGTSAFARLEIYAAGLAALVPAALWYAWAKRFYTLFGNSLGLSNEYPFLGADMLWPPVFLMGLLKWETLGVFSVTGWLLLLAAWSAPRDSVSLPAFWLLSVAALDLVAARTTADDWAFYYHAVSVVPAGLLMGAGFAALRGESAGRVLGFASGRVRRTGAGILAVGVLATHMSGIVYLTRAGDHRDDLRAMRGCGLGFLPLIPADGAIVARGGEVHDDHGFPVAHNASMLFAWLDRRGFTYGDEELSVAHLEGLARRGGRYWIADRAEMRPDLEREVAARFRHLATCARGYDLYDLATGPSGGEAGATGAPGGGAPGTETPADAGGTRP